MVNSYNKLDIWLFGFMIGLVVFGLLAIYSASNGVGTIDLFYKQLIWFGIGLVVMVVVYYIDCRKIIEYSYFLYLLGLFLLILVLFFGTKVSGATSWLRIGFIGIQPSEIAKVTTILALARYLSNDNTDITSVNDVLLAVAIAVIPAGLVMLQPDMGTTLTYLSFIFPVMIMAGFNVYYLLLMVIPFLLTIVGFFNIYMLFALTIIVFMLLVFIRKGFHFSQVIVSLCGLAGGLFTFRFAAAILQPHQMKRIQTFLDPMSDPQGAGYNALQAKIAIGSGGMFGKGFLEGTQTQLRFIPAQWTDFIFCVIGEEMGLIGSIVLLSLFLALFLRMLWLVSVIKNKFVELTLVGFVSLWLVHVMINVGMTIGLFPVIGVPLPFLSYGGSSLLGNMVMVGLALNFFRNKRNLGY
ncbi:rod shape-determining protein RodA [Prosthecochloris sp. SCSIO W1103]|uniref:rod shape-determining protein RodA n=1 Tax=Prosthecochloris sp. SCSIO W1103 TaxID=2992244 RepID=UPI00223D7B0A|nr:rod shape-determining protein RodA [Prosthecochloris sp. SCSIO W1103]UZJ38116.1 rod shape-determining protein RodA [Prosthecochloris sp. SCSIO W1103]